MSDEAAEKAWERYVEERFGRSKATGLLNRFLGDEYEEYAFEKGFMAGRAYRDDRNTETEDERAARKQRDANRGYRALYEQMVDRAAAAEAVIERVREARGNYPRCDVHPGNNVVTCGWKRVVIDIDAALAADD